MPTTNTTWTILSVTTHPTRQNWRNVNCVRGEGRNRQVISTPVHESSVAEFNPATFWNANKRQAPATLTDFIGTGAL